MEAVESLDLLRVYGVIATYDKANPLEDLILRSEVRELSEAQLFAFIDLGLRLSYGLDGIRETALRQRHLME